MRSTKLKLAGDTAYYHITHWKAGSQWFRAVLKDAFGTAVVEQREMAKHAYETPGEQGRVYPSCYLKWQEFLVAPVPAKARRFVLIRDLRDTLVSAYFSLRFSHKVSGQIERHRWFLERWSQEEGLLHLMENWLVQSAWIQRSWLANGERVFKLEDFMAKPAETLGGVFREAWGLEASAVAVEGLAARHAFARYSGGRAPGQEDLKSHYRKGVPGDWRQYFTPPVTERFKAIYNDVLVLSGYETSRDW